MADIRTEEEKERARAMCRESFAWQMAGLGYDPGGEPTRPQRPRRAERRKKPAPLPEPVVYYGKSDTKDPETIRLSFADGHTEIYDRRVNQPRPDSYVNDPRRKRK